jgi:hypothetical protein
LQQSPDGPVVDAALRSLSRIGSGAAAAIDSQVQRRYGMTFRLPGALQDADDGKAPDFLRRYYQQRPGTPLGTFYTGARFDG